MVSKLGDLTVLLYDLEPANGEAARNENQYGEANGEAKRKWRSKKEMENQKRKWRSKWKW